MTLEMQGSLFLTVILDTQKTSSLVRAAVTWTLQKLPVKKELVVMSGAALFLNASVCPAFFSWCARKIAHEHDRPEKKQPYIGRVRTCPRTFDLNLRLDGSFVRYFRSEKRS